MLESSCLADEMGLNHIVKLCWFTRFEMALSMDESRSECMIGAVGARASRGIGGETHARKEIQIA